MPHSGKSFSPRSIWAKTRQLVKNNIKIALVISLLGGVPGSINIYNWWTEKPGFFFYAETISSGMSSDHATSFIIISGAVYNGGKLPLFPRAFSLLIDFGDNKLKIGAAPITDSTLGKSIGSIKIDFRNIQTHDMLKIIRVNPLDAQYGILFFPVKGATDLGTFKSLKISCFDILDEERMVDINMNAMGPGDKGYSFPKTETERSQ